jgi:hypothetical protein
MIDVVCMKCPDFVGTMNWLFSRPRVGRLAGFAWLWFFLSLAVDMDFYNVMFTSNTANQRAAFSEAGAATAITGFTIVLFFLGVQFTIMATMRIKATFEFEARVAGRVNVPRSDDEFEPETEMKTVQV